MGEELRLNPRSRAARSRGRGTGTATAMMGEAFGHTLSTGFAAGRGRRSTGGAQPNPGGWDGLRSSKEEVA